jgi:hypothetical protein
MRYAEDVPVPVHRVIVSPPPGSLLRIVAVAAATTMLAVVLGSGVAAQTLTDPNSQAKQSPPPVNAKPAPAARVKACSAYGPGFINMPGTDACMKIGGFVRMEGTNAPGN